MLLEDYSEILYRFCVILLLWAVGGVTMKRKNGFTLIELLIVLAIISSLLGAFIPSASATLERARGVQIAFNLGSIMRAVEYHILLHGKLPESLDQITRDLDSEKYGVAARNGSKGLTVVVFTKQLAEERVVRELLPGAVLSLDQSEGLSFVEGGLKQFEDGTFFYAITFLL